MAFELDERVEANLLTDGRWLPGTVVDRRRTGAGGNDDHYQVVYDREDLRMLVKLTFKMGPGLWCMRHNLRKVAS